MAADLTPGKNYLSIVTPRMGAWKARFSMWPIKADSAAKYNTSMPEFDKWQKGTTLVNNSEKGRLWYLKILPTLTKNTKSIGRHGKKSDEAIAERSLTPEDGQ
ncbi:hypothetical protein [Gilvimarinus polysaccharolyticus]|uniref:hypothetical protein n=1 Tax=Gilvimarinus polysaccharolyticus TaxID=863921 RepID=UPI00067352FB|nr:hypothetical protein [Gilvimarinus polysaccharolyticus]